MVNEEWVLVGSVGRLHGITGWVRINSYTEPSTNILRYQPWCLSARDNESSFDTAPLQDYQIHGQRLVVQFLDCQTPESARLLVNVNIYVKREQFATLPAKTYYWADLVGLKVYTCQNIHLGVIRSLFSTGSNDVLIVEGEKRYLIPFLQDRTIKSINLVQQMMIVDWDVDF